MTNNNAETLETRRPSPEVVETEPKESNEESAPVADPSTTLEISSSDTGNRTVETKDGQLLRVDYVNTRDIIAGKVAKIKDKEVETAALANTYLDNDDYETAGHIIEDGINASKEKAAEEIEPMDVFGRALRRITQDFGDHSIMSVKSKPDWGMSERNAGEVNVAIAIGMAFIIPENLKDDVLRIFHEESMRGLMNSEERLIETLATDKPRSGDNYFLQTISSKEKSPLFMCFMFGKTEDQKSEEEKNADSSDEESEKDSHDDEHPKVAE